MTDSTGTTTYQYDSLGRPTVVIDSAGNILYGTYDLAGNRTSMQYPNGHTVTMQYDANGQMTGVTDWLGNTTQFQYDGAGRRVKLTAVQVTLDPRKTTTWGYDAANQIIHIKHRDANGVPYATFDYTRAVDGRITTVQSTGLGDPSHTYGYDIQARLGSYDGSLVGFDSRNNVTRLPDGSTLNYDAADQLTSMQAGTVGSTFSYDANGRRTSRGGALYL